MYIFFIILFRDLPNLGHDVVRRGLVELCHEGALRELLEEPEQNEKGVFWKGRGLFGGRLGVGIFFGPTLEYRGI